MKKIILVPMVIILMLSICLRAAAVEPDPVERFRVMAEEAIRNWQAELNVAELNINVDMVKASFSRIRENPEWFYFENYTIWSYPNGLAAKVELHYRDGLGPADIEVFEAAVAKALNNVLTGMDALQTALVLHDYLALTVSYDYENYLNNTIPSISSTAYGALVLRTAVCSGYTQAYRLLLNRCGIENAYVKSESMNHAWTMLRLENSWYHVDVTWDDPVPDTPGMASHKYFLLSDAAISDSEHEHYGWQSDHVCGDTRYDTNVFWNDLDTPIPFTDADTYWLLRESGDYTDQTINLLRRSWSTGEYDVVASVRDYWPAWNRPGWHWSDAYSGLVLWDSRLFFNDKLHVYAYDPDGSQDTVYTYGGGDGYLYGLISDGATLSYLVKQDPNQDGGTLCALPLAMKYPPGPFEDVVRRDYFFDAVQWAYEQGVTTGTGGMMFSPEATCTRAQVMTFLWRATGSPEPRTAGNPFEDVPEDVYYRKAVLWAVEQGITNGTGTDPETGAHFFSPDAKCSYAHILTFLWRCCTGSSTSAYGPWYAEAMNWAIEEGLMRYTAPGIRTDDACPRRDVVTYLWIAQEEVA